MACGSLDRLTGMTGLPRILLFQSSFLLLLCDSEDAKLQLQLQLRSWPRCLIHRHAFPTSAQAIRPNSSDAPHGFVYFL